MRWSRRSPVAGRRLSCVDADTTAITSDAGAPVTGPFSITVAFSEPVTGFELEDLVVGNGSASELQGDNAAYNATITPEASGTVTVNIAAGAAQDDAGNPSAATDQFSIVADLTTGPMNRSPSPTGTLPNRTMAPDDTLNVDVSQAFVDPDDDALTYTVSSSVPQVVTAKVTGALVMLAARSEGAATIRVTATDAGGLSAVQSFTVTVEMSPSRHFTDHPIRPGVTPVKAVHFMELMPTRRQAGGPALDRRLAGAGVNPDQGGPPDGAAVRRGGAGVRWLTPRARNPRRGRRGVSAGFGPTASSSVRNQTWSP